MGYCKAQLSASDLLVIEVHLSVKHYGLLHCVKLHCIVLHALHCVTCSALHRGGLDPWSVAGVDCTGVGCDWVELC